MTRTEKWKYKRVQMDVEKQALATSLLNCSESLMNVHSEISKKAFDNLMGDPIPMLNEIFKTGEQR